LLSLPIAFFLCAVVLTLTLLIDLVCSSTHSV
jgi:hypothetical protein